MSGAWSNWFSNKPLEPGPGNLILIQLKLNRFPVIQ